MKNIWSFKNYSKLAFCEILKFVSWSPVLLARNVDEALDNFCSILRAKVDEIAPVRRVRLRTDTEPWMTANILSMIKDRNALYQKVKRKCGDIDLFSKYCSTRNLVQRRIKDAKAQYFNKSVVDCGNDSGKLWRHLKTLGYKSPKGDSGIVIDSNGKQFFNPSDTARLFNEFYTTVASSLLSRLPSCRGIFGCEFCRNFYRKKSIHGVSFNLTTVSRHYILKQLNCLKVDKSTVLDDISPRFLKDGAAFLVDPIAHIVNFSILSESVPSGFKKARVKPLYKKGSRLELGNYRPVSILPVLSKILERAVNEQLNAYLSKKGLLYGFQSGFQKGYSTETCLLNLCD